VAGGIASPFEKTLVYSEKFQMIGFESIAKDGRILSIAPISVYKDHALCLHPDEGESGLTK
jgi:hypothetical protein